MREKSRVNDVTPLDERERYEKQMLNERGYTLLKKIGEGSYSKVYLAEYTVKKKKKTNIEPPESEGKDEEMSLDKSKDEDKETTLEIKDSVDKMKEDKEEEKPEVMMLAAKIMGGTKPPPKTFYKKFLPRELEILSQIRHEHIIHVHSIFSYRKSVYVFMRYAENGDLLEFLINYGCLSEEQARLWLRQIALALDYLHNKGIAHRDLKCENVLITANMNVKLSDFGFSRIIEVPEGKEIEKGEKVAQSNGKMIYLSQTYCGSLSYTAPEVLRGKPYDAIMSDFWSMGVILYVMLNQKMPFDSKNVRRLYEQQIGRKWIFHSKVENTLSKEVKKVVKGLLHPDLAMRWTIKKVINSEWMKMSENEEYKNINEAEGQKSKESETLQEERRQATNLIIENLVPDAQETEDVFVIFEEHRDKHHSVDRTISWKTNMEAYNNWLKRNEM